jgi:hypothetical protein
MILLGFYSWSLFNDAKQAAKQKNKPERFSSQAPVNGQLRFIRELY